MKKAFTLIEMVVVIALIAILSVTITPRLRYQLAKAKDSRAVALLSAIRLQSKLNYLEGGDVNNLSSDQIILNLVNELDSESLKLLDKNNDNAISNDELNISVGGSKNTSDAKDIVFGGQVHFVYDNGDIHIEAVSPTHSFDSSGTPWSSY